MTTPPTVHPKLVVDDADAAMACWTAAFDAEVVARHTGPGGRVVQAEVAILGTTIMCKDADDVDPVPSPGPILTVRVDDAAATAARLEAAGAAVVFPVADHGYGYVDGRLVDPAGVQWLVSQPV